MKVAKYALFALLAGVILCALLAGPASAATITGGTDAQRAYVQEVLDNGPWTVERVDETWADGVRILILDHNDPYWYPPQNATVLWDANGDVIAWGVAWTDGTLQIYSALQPGYKQFLGEVVAHEWSHMFWYGQLAAFKQEWRAEATAGVPGYDGNNWLQSPAENFAESAKLLWDSRYLYLDYSRTDLKQWMPDETRAFIARYEPVSPPPPPPPPIIFSDVDRGDAELYGATAYLRERGIILGYEDGTFRPGGLLLKRHVAFICERAGLVVPGWINNWGPATRGEVRDFIPGLTWDSERWDESVTRGQLARLLWRLVP